MTANVTMVLMSVMLVAVFLFNGTHIINNKCNNSGNIVNISNNYNINNIVINGTCSNNTHTVNTINTSNINITTINIIHTTSPTST